MDPQGTARGDDFDADLSPGDVPDGRAGHADQSTTAALDKRIQRLVPDLSADELARLTVLEPGTRLEQGSVYLDLDDAERVPFRALASQTAAPGRRLVAKRDTDHELWSRLTPDGRDTEIERPTD
jgi:hypothetical protein